MNVFTKNVLKQPKTITATNVAQRQINKKTPLFLQDNRTTSIIQQKIKGFQNRSLQAEKTSIVQAMMEQYTPNESRAIQRKTADSGVIQLCTNCGDSSCKKGEKCRKPPSGMFTSGSGSWGTKFYNQKQGHGGKPMEWEHPVPGKAYRTAGMGQSYKSAPVLQIPKKMHRSGVSGMGGGISSTGSSTSAKTWSTGMGGQLASGDWQGTIWKGVIDGLHSAAATGQDLQTAANGYWRIIRMHQQRGDIDEQTAQALLRMLMNALHNMTSRPDLYGGPKGPPKGPPGPGPSGTGGSMPIKV